MNDGFALPRRIAREMIRALLVSTFLGGYTDVAADLPPDIAVDRYWLGAKRLMDEKDYLGALAALDTLKSLQKTSNLPLPDAFQFVVAQAALPAGKIKRARDAVDLYLEETGRLGDHYKAALKLLDDAERALPEMVVIPKGACRIVYDTGVDCQRNERQADCKVDSPLAISKYEVTFEQYDRFVAATGYARPGDNGWGRGRRPVIRVSWHDAMAYTRWLSSVTGEFYRLPSEAEWEYAARADSTKRSRGNEICSNDSTREGSIVPWNAAKTVPVGSFKPNAWGLFDLDGNVSEWVNDCSNKDFDKAPHDGSARESGDCSRRVTRGGWWGGGRSVCRPEKRIRKSMGCRASEIGFRVARSIKVDSSEICRCHTAKKPE